jgi:predicted metalloprotease with PDZ domain
MITEIAHEYFHVWSPKRIHVRQLGPFDYQSPPNTKSLWFAEGLTEYYSRMIPLRAGILARAAFLNEFSGDLEDYYHKRASMPATEVSLHISTVGEEVSTPALYSKGPVIGLLLDAAIRSATNNAKSLDDAMRYFNTAYGASGRTFGDDDIIPIIDTATGVDLRGFYARYVDGTDPLPIDEYLPKIGMKFDASTVIRRTMGAEMNRIDTGYEIVSVEPRGSADAMGLRAGDLIVGLDINHTELPISALPMGIDINIAAIENTDSLTFVRNGTRRTVAAIFRQGPVAVRIFTVDPAANPQAVAIRRSMFGF